MNKKLESRNDLLKAFEELFIGGDGIDRHAVSCLLIIEDHRIVQLCTSSIEWIEGDDEFEVWCEGMFECDEFEFFQLLESILIREIPSIRGVHRELPLATRTEFEGLECAREPIGSPPLLQYHRILECLPESLWSRIEDMCREDVEEVV